MKDSSTLLPPRTLCPKAERPVEVLPEDASLLKVSSPVTINLALQCWQFVQACTLSISEAAADSSKASWSVPFQTSCQGPRDQCRMIPDTRDAIARHRAGLSLLRVRLRESMTHNVFVYGSLLADEVVQALLHRLPETRPGGFYGLWGCSISTADPYLDNWVAFRYVCGVCCYA